MLQVVNPRPKIGIKHYIFVTGLIALATLVIYWLRASLGDIDLSLIYLLLVLYCAVLGTRALTIYCGVAGFLCYAFFVIPPAMTFFGYSPVRLLDPLAFLVVALVAGELAEQSRQYAVQAATYKQASQFRTTLLRLISHNLRTPVATIKTALGGLVDARGATIGNSELIMAAEQEVDRLNRLIGNVLQLSRLEANTLLLQQDWNALDEVISVVFSRWPKAVSAHQLYAEMPDHLPLIKFDFTLIEGVLTNLVENAIRHGTPPVVVNIQLQQQEVQITVVDGGPQDAATRTTAPTLPFESSTTGNLGVGLMVCKGLVEAHHGRLWSQFESGKTRFFFTLPLIIYEEHDVEPIDENQTADR